MYNINAIQGAKGAFEGFLRVKIRIGKDGSRPFHREISQVVSEITR